jgi:mono/diheme cytochrome c family protein
VISINTGASARCIQKGNNLQPFQRLTVEEQTVKTVWLVRRIFHRAKASVLMRIRRQRLTNRRGLSSADGRKARLARAGCALPLLMALAALGLAGCRPDMMNQPKADPLSESDFFPNGTNARQVPAHTVAYGDAREDTAFYTGLTNGFYITKLPTELTPQLLARGQERFNAICAECHDRTGSGNGMVVQRGFPQPPSFHVDRLRNAPIGHFFDVITNGYGVMYSYATRVDPEDRWAIAAYIRALQLSHNASLSDVSPEDRATLEGKR